MDYFGVARSRIRSDAFKRLAKLSVENEASDLFEPTITSKDGIRRMVKLMDGRDKGSTEMSKIAMDSQEYDILVALCESTEYTMRTEVHAELLLEKLRLYLFELPSQRFNSLSHFKRFSSTPWSILSRKLTNALINIGFQFDRRYLTTVINIFSEFNDVFFKTDSFELSHYLTLLGILEGLTDSAKFLVYSEKSYEIFTALDTYIDNFEFLNDLEIFSNTLYSSADYFAMLDHDLLNEFSPILYIERLSKLMGAMLSNILGSNYTGLLSFLLAKVSVNFEFDPIPDLDISESQMGIVKKISDLAIQKMEFLDRGETYVVYSTFNRLKLGYLAKSHNLQVLGFGTFTDNIDPGIAKRIFYNCLDIKDVMLDADLGLSVIQLGALLVFKNENVGSFLTRSFTTLVANPRFSYCDKASESLGLASKVLSQDIVVTTIYTLSNLLFVGDDNLPVQSRKGLRRNTNMSRYDNLSVRDALSSSHDSEPSFVGDNLKYGDNFDATEVSYDEKENRKVYENAITAIIEVSKLCDDQSVSTLSVTILSQKFSKADANISALLLKGLVCCAPYLPEREFVILSRLLGKMSLDAYAESKDDHLKDLIEARVELARKLQPDNELHLVYLREVLKTIVSKGDVEVLEHHRSHNEISEIGDQIGIHLSLLAELLPDVHNDEPRLEIDDSEIINLMRNVWFNLVVHGYSNNSKNARKYSRELEKIAYNTPPLVSELSWDRTETSLELNTVLKRGSSNHNVKDHRHIMGDIFEVHRTMSYPKLMFLSATVFIESLRVKSGDCSTILEYYTDPSTKVSGVDKYIGHISFKIVHDFIKLVNLGGDKRFGSESIAEELTKMLLLCCHRIEELQDAAIQCCDVLINKIPSSLCHHKSLFALFDLLSLMFRSVVDAEEHLYEPTTSFKADITGIELKLSDSYSWRKDTFSRFHEKCKHWVRLILLKSEVDVKSLVQSYVSANATFQHSYKVQFGVSFALEMAGSILSNNRELTSITKSPIQQIDTLPVFVSQLTWRSNFISEIVNKLPLNNEDNIERAFPVIREKITNFRERLDSGEHVPNEETVSLLSEIAGLTIIADTNSAELVRYLVDIPFQIFESSIMNEATGIWLTVMKDKRELSVLILSEIAKRAEISIEERKGLYSRSRDLKNPEFTKMEYSPSDNKTRNRMAHVTSQKLNPHLQIINLFSSSFEATLNQSDHLLKLFTNFVEVALSKLYCASLHPFARYVRFELIRFAFEVLNYHSKLGSRNLHYLTGLILDGSLSWFKQRAVCPYGSNSLKMKADYGLLKEVTRLISHMPTLSSDDFDSKRTILMFFLDDEISKMSVWMDPSNPQETKGDYISTQISGNHISKAYSIDPVLAINLSLRYKVKNLDEILQKMLMNNPLPALFYADAVQYLIGINAGTSMPSHHLLFWEPLSTIDSITLFLPPFGNNPYILQYTMRSLEYHDVNLTFFYVPQIVQSLRFDNKGYVERFILETANVSSLFAHQIIWNMLANSYKDEDSEVPDSLKPTLDKVKAKMIKFFDKEEYQFYEREFSFFNEVTSISGKLRPFIKKSKAEKKIKIDEEMSKIQLLPDVYLPSNPDGILVDINRKSGKPLQSHAKAPFIATFKILKEIEEVLEDGTSHLLPIEKWQSAIFKVGDDCRQDVLALQLISVFRTIWDIAGLDLFVYPYRVTATAPGCGVIDVLPNSISRDMLGREAVNGLYEYFITKFGPENSIEFQQARNNLIKSLAAYSIISYILQFKDRHNGNIMYDDQGHVLHIDFGFCFDIVPGGVKFEVAPFKLTHEMVLVLGGGNHTQAFRWFEELCIKGFLACRPYMETIVRCVTPMLETGLPCFKDTTIKKLRSRFVPTKSEKDACNHMRSLIKKSMESVYTKGYDEFQRITNGIPY